MTRRTEWILSTDGETTGGFVVREGMLTVENEGPATVKFRAYGWREVWPAMIAGGVLGMLAVMLILMAFDLVRPYGADAQAVPSFAVEAEPSGMRLTGTANGTTRQLSVTFRWRDADDAGTSLASIGTVVVPWNALRGTVVVPVDTLSETISPGDRVAAMVYLQDQAGRQLASYTVAAFDWEPAGTLDIRTARDDVIWPGADLIRSYADAGGVPAPIVWVFLGMGAAFIALVGIGGMTQSPAMGGIAGGIVLGLVTTPTIGIASVGLLLVYAMAVIGVCALWSRA